MLWFTTFVCLTLGLWEICEKRAISDVSQSEGGWTPSVVLPYVLRVSKSHNITVRETYHLWALGYVVRIPYSNERPNDDPIILTVGGRVIIQPEQELAANPFDPTR